MANSFSCYVITSAPEVDAASCQQKKNYPVALYVSAATDCVGTKIITYKLHSFRTKNPVYHSEFSNSSLNA